MLLRNLSKYYKTGTLTDWHKAPSSSAPIKNSFTDRYGLPTVDFLTVGTIRSRWSRPPKHFTIPTDGSRRTAAGRSRPELRKHQKRPPEESTTFYSGNLPKGDSKTIGTFGDSTHDHGAAARRLPSVRISKLFCARLQPLPMAPSVKTFPDSDRREPPNSRGKVAARTEETPETTP